MHCILLGNHCIKTLVLNNLLFTHPVKAFYHTRGRRDKANAEYRMPPVTELENKILYIYKERYSDFLNEQLKNSCA